MAVHTDTSNQKGIKRQRSSISADKKKDNKKAYIPSYVQEGEKCVVCGDNSTGTHYRAMTCEGCKGFFRRTIQKSKGAEPDLICKKDGACEISPQTRNACQYCRYKRCLAMKMDPNSVLNEKERKNLKQLIDTNRKERKKRVCQALTTEEWNFLKGIGESYKAIQVSDFYKFMNKKELREQEVPYIPGQMSPSLRHVVEFVRSIPGINKLSPVDICELFFKHLLDIVGLRLAELFDLQENELCFRNFRLRESDLEQYCYMKEMFYFAREYARFVSQDGIILGCLCAIRFLSLDNSKLLNEAKVTETLETIQHVFLKFLGQERVPSVHTIYSRLVNFENIREYRSKILAKMAMLGSGCQDESELSLSPQPGARQTEAPGLSNPQPPATNHLDRPFYQDLIREFSSSEGEIEAGHSNHQDLIGEINSTDVNSHELSGEINLSEVNREASYSNMGGSHADIIESNSSLDNMKRSILETVPISEFSYLACNMPSNSSNNVLVVDRENLVTNIKQETVHDHTGGGVGRVSIQVDTSDLVLLQINRGTDMTDCNTVRQDVPAHSSADFSRTAGSVPHAVAYDLASNRSDDRDRAAVTIIQNGSHLKGGESGISDFSMLPWMDDNGQGMTSRYDYLNGFQTNASRSPELLRYKPSHATSPYKIFPVGSSPNRSKVRVVESCQGLSYAADVNNPTPLDLTRDPQTAMQALLLKNAALEATVRRLQYQQHSSRDVTSVSLQPDWMPNNYPGYRGSFADGHTQGSAFLSPSPDKHSSEYYHRQALSPPVLPSHKFNEPSASHYPLAIPSTSGESSHSPVPPSTHRYPSHPLAIPSTSRESSHSPVPPSTHRYPSHPLAIPSTSRESSHSPVPPSTHRYPYHPLAIPSTSRESSHSPVPPSTHIYPSHPLAIPNTSRESSHSPVLPSTHKYPSHPLAIPSTSRESSHSPVPPSTHRYPSHPLAIPSTSRESSHSPVLPSTHRYPSHPLAIPSTQSNVSHSPILPSSRRYSPAAEGTYKNSSQSLALQGLQRYSPSSYSQIDVQGHEQKLLYTSAGSYYHNPSIDMRLEGSLCYKRQEAFSEEKTRPQSAGSKTYYPSYSPDSSTTDSFSLRHLGKLVIKSSPPSSSPPSPRVNMSTSRDFPGSCSSSSPCDHLTPPQSTVIKRETRSRVDVELIDICDRHNENSYKGGNMSEDSDKEIDESDKHIDVCGKGAEDCYQLTDKDGDNKTPDAHHKTSGQSLKKRWRDDYLKRH